MKTSLFRLFNNRPERTRNALFVIIIYLVGSIVAGGILTAQAVQVASWQSWAAALSVFLVSISSITAWLLVQRGRIDLGIWILIVSTYIAAIFLILAISGLGVVMLAAAIALSSMVAIQSLQSYQSIMFISGVVVGIASLLLDFSLKTERISSPIFQVLTYVLVPLMAIPFGIVIVRQYRNYTLRNKMMVAFIGVTLGTAAILSAYTFTNTANTLRQGLERELKQHVDSVASNISALFGEQVTALTTLSLNEIFQAAAADANASYQGDAAEIQAFLEARDAQWQAADQADNNNDPLVRQYLSNIASQDLVEFQRNFPDHVEVFITDKYGGLIGTGTRISDYYQADEPWWKAAYNQGQGALYISEPKYDQSADIFAIQIALPLRDSRTNEVIGVLRTTYQTSALLPILSKAIGETGKTELYIPGRPAFVLRRGQLDPADPNQLNEFQTISGQGLVEMDYHSESDANAPIAGADTPSVVILTSMQDLGQQTEFNKLGWIVLFHQDETEAYAPINAGIQGAVIVLILVIIMAVLGAYVLSSFLVRPITKLTRTAEEVAAGKLDSRAESGNTDEIGVLATTFNSMTSQLQTTLQGLEQRVTERTRNLELAAEVGRSVSQLRALDVMLKDACDLILKEFDLYYVQVYLTDASERMLRLEAGTGTVGAQLVGRRHSLPLDSKSINGRAAVEKRSVIISDTTQSDTFRPNPLLPETRSEMAVPLVIAGRVVGVLDVQSQEPGALTEDVLPAFEALAGQLTIAIQNANLLAETEEARAEVEKQARRLVRAGWSEHLDAIHKPEQIGFVFDRMEIRPVMDLSELQTDQNKDIISSSISITGESMGSLVVELNDNSRATDAAELIGAVSRQVAQQVENLRILNSAERYRLEAEAASRRLTREGWKSYTERTNGSIGYVYDLNEVRPQTSDDQMVKAAGYTLPLKVREETIGRLIVQGLEDADEEALGIASTVAERLSAHIESLRQFDESKHSQLELDKRAKQLAAVAEVSTASTALLDPTQVLQSVVDLTKERFYLYHAHVYLLNESGDTLKLSAGAGDVGRQMVAEGWKISVDHEDSIVARAVRTRQSVISNDIVHDKESEFLSNRLLPDTRSEMAVPLMVGDYILGVFDVQSDRINAFTEEDANIQTTLASQVATSLQNARSFAQAQKQAERESRLNVISQKIQSATTVEAVLQIAARELGHTLGAPLTIAQLGLKETANGN